MAALERQSSGLREIVENLKQGPLHDLIVNWKQMNVGEYNEIKIFDNYQTNGSLIARRCLWTFRCKAGWIKFNGKMQTKATKILFGYGKI